MLLYRILIHSPYVLYLNLTSWTWTSSLKCSFDVSILYFFAISSRMLLTVEFLYDSTMRLAIIYNWQCCIFITLLQITGFLTTKELTILRSFNFSVKNFL